jgi:hypothetical protein
MGTPSFPITARASSGLAVSFASNTPSTCSVSGDTVTLLGAGQCSIAASQSGNTVYTAANTVTQSFQITLAPQTIAFTAISAQTLGGTLALNASATSSLPVTFASSTPAVCAVSGATATPISAGTCTIQATQAGNSQYAEAATVFQSFTVNQASSTTALTALSTTPKQGQADLLTATVTGSGQPGGTVVFSAGGTTVCTSTLNHPAWQSVA